LLKKGPDQWLYGFCNLGTDVLTAFDLRWKNAGAIRSVSCLQTDGRWRRLKFRVAGGNDGCSPTIVFETNLNCYDGLVLWVKEQVA
jgi:hypothetical protein